MRSVQDCVKSTIGGARPRKRQVRTRPSSTASTRMAENRKGDVPALRRSADARVAGGRKRTPKRDRPGRGCLGQRIAGRQALKGMKTSREDSGLTSRRARISATEFRAAHAARAGTVMTASLARLREVMPIGSATHSRRRSTSRRSIDREHDAAIARHIRVRSCRRRQPEEQDHRRKPIPPADVRAKIIRDDSKRVGVSDQRPVTAS